MAPFLAGPNIIAHTRKEEADYALSAVAGTGGLTAAADAGLLLSKASTGAKLQVVSRDVDESEFSLVRDPETAGWVIADEGAGPLPNEGKRGILDLLDERGPLTSREIQDALSKEKPGTVRSWLYRLVEDRRVSQGLDQKYRLADHTEQSDLFAA